MAQATMKRPAPPAVKETQLLINNEWVDPVEGSASTPTTRRPAQVIAKVAAASAKDVDKAVKAARTRLESGPWGKMDAADRGRLLYKLADLVEKEAEELAALESLNCGKTINDSVGDMQGVVNTLRYYAGWADKIEGKTVPVRGNFLSYTLRQPVGVVGQIIPWNFPLLMLAWKWGPALACGNTVVMKPAEQTPLTALRIGELAMEAGFPAGVVNILNGMGETTGAALVVASRRGQDRLHRPRRYGQDHPEGGGRHAQAHHVRAGRQKRPTSSSPTPTWSRPSPARSTPSTSTAASAARPAAGSSSRRRSIRSSSSAWPRRPRNARSAIRSIPTTEQGPQVSKEQMDKILGYCELGQKQGATLLTGGQRHRRQGLLRRADHLRQRQGRNGHRQGRNLRAGRQRAAVQEGR